MNSVDTVLHPATERFSERQEWKNVTEINCGTDRVLIIAGEAPVRKFETVPGPQFENDPNSQIFWELKRICSSASGMPVVLKGEKADFSGPFLAVIRPAGYKGEPRLVKKPFYIANPDGSSGEEICDYVVRDFEIRFHSRHRPGEILATTDTIEKKVAETVEKYLEAINKEYACYNSSFFALSPGTWVTADGTIKSTTYRTFSIIYPASMEPPRVPGKKE